MTFETVRLAAVGDLHCSKMNHEGLGQVFGGIGERADILVLCGDLTDYGLPEEARGLAKALALARIPVVGVLGNHDYHSGKERELKKILCDAGMHVLDGETAEVRGIGFAGVKGFCGGFGRHTLEPWGEPGIKSFVHESVEEALKLESALARLTTPQRIAVLHYAPIEGTVIGEPLEIYPFLGSSRLEEPLNRYQATMAFHGHAHTGRAEGATSSGVPVYNVAIPVLKRTMSDEVPVRIIEVQVPASSQGPTASAGA